MSTEESSPTTGAPATLFAVGLTLGAAVGTSVAVLADVNIASGISAGAGGGILLAASLQLIGGKWSQSRSRIGGLIGAGLGATVGLAIGTVSAWGSNLSLVAGAMAGVPAGAVLGIVLAWLQKTQL